MLNEKTGKRLLRQKRKWRTRKCLRGSAEKPRLCVVKTNQHIQVQLIDDDTGKTLASTGTLSKEFRKTKFNKKNKESAQQLGEKIAALALEKNINRVVFDRGFHKYHGILAALADAAREKGLQF